jgi:uncharacterized surface protein with fasciclin (FAS1) repeats
MRSVRISWFVLPVVMLGLVGLSLAQEKKPEPAKPAERGKKVEPPAKEKDIVDTAKADATLKTFCKLLEAAGLEKELKEKGPFTVFAPTDAAFEKLGKEKVDELMKPENKAELKKFLLHHLVRGKHMAKDLEGQKELKTMSGEVKVTVKDGKVTIDTAEIVKADLAASNGVIHHIDATLEVKAGEKHKPEGHKHGGS